MKKIMLLFLLIAIGTTFHAQSTQFTKSDESDPAAKAILDKVRNRYEAYKSLDAEFSLDIEIPEQPKESQKGKISRSGNKYRLEMPSQTIISDGKSLWVVFHNNKEVQINDLPEEEEDFSLISPQSLFNFYDQEEFVYALVNEFSEKGKVVQQIEFKPLDRFADYSKIRLTVDKKTATVLRIKLFGKDSARFTFNLGKVTPNKSFPANTFKFDKSAYEGYYIEDLRE